MDYPSRPYQDFELRVSRTGMPNPTEPPVVDQLAAGSGLTMPLGKSGPTVYKVEMTYADGRLLSVELGPFPSPTSSRSTIHKPTDDCCSTGWSRPRCSMRFGEASSTWWTPPGRDCSAPTPPTTACG